MKIILLILAAIGTVGVYYILFPVAKSAIYLVKLRKTEGVGDFTIDLADSVLSSDFHYNNHLICIKTKIEHSSSFSDALHTSWQYYDCMRCTFDETIRIAKVNPDLEKVYYIYSNDGGLIHEY